MEQKEFDFNAGEKKKTRQLPEWYTEKNIRLNYSFLSQIAKNSGLPFPSYKEYVIQIKEGTRTLAITGGHGY